MPCETPCQHEFGARPDVGGGPVAAIGAGHGEGERGLADEIDLIAQVGGVARGGLAALLGADARDDQAANTVAGEPDVEPAADERAVPTLAEHRIGRDGERRERGHKPRVFCKGTVIGDVEHLDDGQSRTPWRHR